MSITTAPSIAETARSYLEAGLAVLPADRAGKRPQVGLWKRYQQRLPTQAELDAWLANRPEAICILSGAVSGNGSGGLEMIDFDCAGEAFGPWMAKVDAVDHDLLSNLVVERTPSGGSHVIYRSEQPVCGNLKLAQRKVGDEIQTLIETRGEGGLFLCAPTPGYELLQGDFAELPVLTEAQRDVLLQAAWSLNEYVPPVINGPQTSSAPSPGNIGRPGDDFNERGDVRPILQNAGWQLAQPGENELWRRPGKSSGWSASLKDGVFYVFSSNAAPFEPNKPYAPFAVYALLRHGGNFDEAARELRLDGYGSDRVDAVGSAVDISAITAAFEPVDSDEREMQEDLFADHPDNPGPTPDHLLYVPGFIGEYVEWADIAAPYRSRPMAFCGALAMLGHLTGRKVCDFSDLRTNLYVLALAPSGTGKNIARQMNAHMADMAGIGPSIRNRFSSGEGIEDRLAEYPATLFQTDEMDTLFNSAKSSPEARWESAMAMMLTMFSSAAMSYPVRTRAGKQDVDMIYQPHLTILGTATPGNFYESMTERMLTNGLFARMVVVDALDRHDGCDGLRLKHMPQRLIEIAQWWVNFEPGEHRANLKSFYPDPVEIEYTPSGKAVADDYRRRTDEAYRASQREDDNIGMAVWARANEHARKLALVYACSENHEKPVVGNQAIDWASRFIEHQVSRMLFMVAQYSANSQFEATLKKAMRILRDWHEKEGKLEPMPPWRLRRRLKEAPQTFENVVLELKERRYAEVATVEGKTKPKSGYRLLVP